MAGLERAEANLPGFEQVEYLAEVVELLDDDVRHFATQFDVPAVSEDQTHRYAGRLFFAMGVIDQDGFQIAIDLSQPSRLSFAMQAQHVAHILGNNREIDAASIGSIGVAPS